MKPADPKAWADPYALDAPIPKRRPPSKRGHRQRMRDRTRRLQRALKFSAPKETR